MSGQGQASSSKAPKFSEYYDTLGVKCNATSAEIRRAYYAAAVKYHPDKNLDSKEFAEERFKKVGEAYQVLSNPELRRRYDEFGSGPGVTPEGGFMDARDFFRHTFGGDAFVEIIGEISFAKMLNDAYEEGLRAEQTSSSATRGDEQMPAFLSDEARKEMERVRKERVQFLTEKLYKKLTLYTEALYRPEEFREYIQKEANNLKEESYGIELLHSIGYVYSMKARQHLGKSKFLGLSSWYHHLREKGHIVSEIVSTATAAREIYVDAKKGQKEIERRQQQTLHDHRSSGEQQQSPASDDKVDEANIDEAKVRRVIWKASALEVESVLRDVCDNVLHDKSATSHDLTKRAMALKVIGDVYRHVKAEPDKERIK